MRTDLEALADLAVTLGANVQRGQILTVGASLGQEPLARAIAASAYRRGASFVDVAYFDPHVKRARILHAPDETLELVPSWYRERILAVGRERAARISLTGPADPGVLDGLDPVRAGRDQLPFVGELLTVLHEHTTNWSVVPCPSAGWAELVFGGLEPEERLPELWRQIAHVCRLDEPDPAAAWAERLETLKAIAGRLNARRLDAVRFEGPGTDLELGLLPTSTWLTAEDQTVDGIVHLSNLPTEEIYCTPDPQRADGHVRSTRPLVLGDGTIIRGLRVRFEAGRAVEIDADEGGGVLRGRAQLDEGASRLGEVALVDRDGRIGRLGTVFYDTLLDENATSHIALGAGDDDGLSAEDAARRNHSSIHVDVMVGGEEVDVTGVTRDGEEVPILRGGRWQL